MTVAQSLLEGVATVTRLECLWRGHDDRLLLTPTRLAMRCATCGRETVGWILDVPRPAARSWGPDVVQAR